MGDLIKSLIHAANKLKQTQDTYQETAVSLQQTITTNRQQIDNLSNELEGIKQILREGFRLSPSKKEH
jgi:uncharacterized coiled-coil DUF342 family protein